MIKVILHVITKSGVGLHQYKELMIIIIPPVETDKRNQQGQSRTC